MLFRYYPLFFCFVLSCAVIHLKISQLFFTFPLLLLHCILYPSFSFSLFMLLIQEIHELKDQIQDVEAKHMQNLKELKVHVW